MDYNYTVFDDGYLYHYGMPKRSGRYRYGSGKNPYQRVKSAVKSGGNKAYKAAKKKLNNNRKYKIEKSKAKLASEKAAKKKQYEKELLSREPKGKKETELKKELLMKSRDPELVFKNRNLFTNKELVDFKTRYELENSVLRLAPEKISKGRQFVNTFSKNADAITTILRKTGDGLKAANDFVDQFDRMFGGTKVSSKPNTKSGNETEKKDNNNNSNNNSNNNGNDGTNNSQASGQNEKTSNKQNDNKKKNASNNVSVTGNKTVDDVLNVMAKSDYNSINDMSSLGKVVVNDVLPTIAVDVVSSYTERHIKRDN